MWSNYGPTGSDSHRQGCQFFNHYVTTHFFSRNGMELYLQMRAGHV